MLTALWCFGYLVFWGPRGCCIFFLNNIFNFKGNCVLCTLKKSFAIFWAWRTYIHTRLGQINSLKGSYLQWPKCKPLGNVVVLCVVLLTALWFCSQVMMMMNILCRILNQLSTIGVCTNYFLLIWSLLFDYLISNLCVRTYAYFYLWYDPCAPWPDWGHHRNPCQGKDETICRSHSRTRIDEHWE